MANPFGSIPGIIVGVGAGGAASAALEPAIEIPRQEAWKANQARILDAGLIARLVAQGGVSLGDGANEAARDGFSSDQFHRLVYLAQTVPGIGEAMTLWRRGLITDDLFSHVLTKEGLDARYVAGIVANKTAEPLGLGDIAYAVVRGILPAPSWVPVAPPTSGDKVPRFPVVDVDPVKLAELTGYDEQALQIMVGRSGLSMAPGLAAQALFRGVIGPKDYLLAIAEGDLRTEWADALRDVSRQILTSAEYAEAALRGWLPESELPTYTAKHGMSPEDTDLLYKTRGRPITVHQVTTGLARGGTYPSTYADVPEPYQKAIRESNIRPEWADLDYANRYTYPSGFQIRAEAQAGHLTAAETEQILLELGWSPKWASHFSQAWTGGTATGGDAHVSKAQTQLWTALHRSYVNDRTDDTTAMSVLATIGVAGSSVSQVLALWQAERELVRSGLSPAAIKKAYHETTFTLDEATARLVELGWSVADAHVYLPE